jgi:predicted AlkP superfamily phosphohydrolase/phosphomutase
MEPSASPALWTTIATGVPPERHGIHGFVVGESRDGTDPAGGGTGDGDGARAAGGRTGGPPVRPVTSAMRRAPAFWNILPEFDRKVGVVGWLVTWPAEPVDGFVVSSYLPYVFNWSTGRPLKGTVVEGIPHQTFPEGLIDEVEALKVKPAELEGSMVRRFYDPDRVARLSRDGRECVAGFLWSLACDETYRRIALLLYERYPVDLFAVYFGGVDVASHRFWKFAWPDDLRYGVGAEEAAILGRVIEEYYVYVDGALAEYLERLAPEDTLVVLSDHGFKPVLLPGRPTTSGHHREEGILVLYGGAARRGGRITSAGLLDVLPTLLAILDVPIAVEMEGRVLREAIDPEFLDRHPPRTVDRYQAAGGAPLPDQSEVDANVLERLRSLGYID